MAGDKAACVSILPGLVLSNHSHQSVLIKYTKHYFLNLSKKRGEYYSQLSHSNSLSSVFFSKSRMLWENKH